MQSIIQQAQQLSADIIKDRRALHQIPELGVYLPQTAAYVKGRLAAMGISHQSCGVHHSEDREKAVFAGFPDMPESTGVVATIGKQGGPCILLRADMDALPIRETTGLPFAANSNNGHMCGHDAHTAMLLGAAQLLKAREAELPGCVKLMFQPGEELGYGARTMVEAGVLEGPTVHAALGVHIMSQVPVGTARFCRGVASSSLDTFMLKIQGKGGHSSAPQDTIDPLVAANQLYSALNLLVPREVDPAAFVTLNGGVLNSGTASNVIPDTADFQLGFRSLDVNARNHLLQRIPEVIRHYMAAWRCSYSTKSFHTPSTVCDGPFSSALLPYVAEVMGEGNVHETPPMAGTEDFGYISERVPSMYLQLGGGAPDNAPHHNPNMVLEEAAFAQGAAIYANCAAEWLSAQHN